MLRIFHFLIIQIPFFVLLQDDRNHFYCSMFYILQIVIAHNLQYIYLMRRIHRQYATVFKRAMLEMKHNKVKPALRDLRLSIWLCPVSHKKELSNILRHLGIALNKIGFKGAALKAWSDSCKITKNKSSRDAIKRLTNNYGMPKQKSRCMDDWRAFYSIQLKKYLGMKRSSKLSNRAEMDMVRQVISQAFLNLQSRGLLAKKGCEEKKKFFYNQQVVFPTGNDPLQKNDTQNKQCIIIDFDTHKPIKPETPCYCGSKLAYKTCCGRIPSLDELLCGR